jgi:hypothetical protein
LVCEVSLLITCFFSGPCFCACCITLLCLMLLCHCFSAIVASLKALNFKLKSASSCVVVVYVGLGSVPWLFVNQGTHSLAFLSNIYFNLGCLQQLKICLTALSCFSRFLYGDQARLMMRTIRTRGIQKLVLLLWQMLVRIVMPHRYNNTTLPIIHFWGPCCWF